MSTLSDVQALYGSVRHTWSKSQAHVIAHVVLAGVVFGICGATIPEMSVTPIDPTHIANNEWFKLANDTGIIYVAFVIPVVMLAAYATLLQAGGRLLVVALMLILPPSSRANQYRLITPLALEPLALTLEKTDFHLSDLQRKSAEFVQKYQSQKNAQWDSFQQYLSTLTKNAQVYLGDFLLFLLVWGALFKLLPQASWIQANEARYWPVALILLTLAWFAWFRVSRAISVVPSLLMMYVSAMIRADPDMRATLDVSEEEHENLRRKLEELLRNEQERVGSRPSLLGYIRYKLGFRRKCADNEEPRQDFGLPFASLYEDGFQFSRDRNRYARYDRQWLEGYLAYLYYCLHKRLSGLARTVWQLARYIITGAP